MPRVKELRDAGAGLLCWTVTSMKQDAEARKIVDNVTFSWSEIDFVRVMDNVISNAYYYSKDFSVFEIHLRDTEGLQIVCMSTPISIEDITIDTIFNKGVRGTSSSDKNNYGKGYGLYLCRLLLSTIEGSIQAEIVNENVKFTINL
mgnify:CR=1 FL=1